jgi:hypothetical protein
MLMPDSGRLKPSGLPDAPISNGAIEVAHRYRSTHKRTLISQLSVKS